MKFLSKIKFNIRLAYILTLCLVFVVLFLNMKVHPHGVPYYHVAEDRHVGGPYESSGSTSRYVLTKALATTGKFYFDTNEARFAAPDVSGGSGKYFSLFAPGVSFIAVPFFYMGLATGYEQFTTYLTNIFFAVLSALMIMLILKRYGYRTVLQIIAALIFVFATNAFTYSLYLTQHLISAFIILSAIYITTFKPSILTNLLLGALFGVGLTVDVPNAFMLIPSILYYGLKQVDVQQIKEKITISLKTVIVFMALGLIPFIILIGYYNQSLTGSPTILPQFVGRISDIDVQVDRQNQNANAVIAERQAAREFGEDSPFQSRFILNGLYILFISDERGWLYYSPILIMGLLGIIFIYKKKESQELLFVPVTIFLINALLYAMFGDPWGGWSFGARYMIPGAAVMVLFLPEVFVRFRKNIILTVLVSAVIVYSIAVNSLGAKTTAAIPPKQEVIHTKLQIPYTYDYNLQLIEKNESYSMIHTYFLKNVSAKDTWIYETTMLSIIIVLPLLYLSIKDLVLHFKKK